MESTELLVVCAAAFLAVFVVLAFLALSMRLISFVFPERKVESDTALVAAVAATVQTLFPGAKVTKMEERK